jgi:hypothetical protein
VATRGLKVERAARAGAFTDHAIVLDRGAIAPCGKERRIAPGFGSDSEKEGLIRYLDVRRQFGTPIAAPAS